MFTNQPLYSFNRICNISIDFSRLFNSFLITALKNAPTSLESHLQLQLSHLKIV